jgi:hypothetical protein
MSEGEEWQEWRPPYASHVVGKFTRPRVDPETGQREIQTYTLQCETCNTLYGPLKCHTGLIRNHISTFAIQHLHRSPLEPPKKKVP